jgi:hypothetical protein
MSPEPPHQPLQQSSDGAALSTRRSARDVRAVSRILPDLDDNLLVELFHKGARASWTSRDLDFVTPLRLTERQRQALARLLTPIYFGEQTAMAGASAVLPQLMQARESSAQLYLASFIMDEARHFEALTRLYQVLRFDPLGLRDLPELLVYHHRLRQGDRVDWVWGILFSDLIAKHFYRAFGDAWGDPLLARLATRILQDESRHLAFAEHYLKRNVPTLPEARRAALRAMRDDLFALLETMTTRVRGDAADLDIDADAYLQAVHADVAAFARRVGIDRSGDDPPPDVTAPSPALREDVSPPSPGLREDVSPPSPGLRGASRPGDATTISACLGCVMALVCGRRLALA